MSVTPLSAAQRTALNIAVREYHSQLYDAPEVLDYIYGRGVTDETIRDFKLGAVKTPIDDGHRRFLGGLVIPNFCASEDEHAVGIKVRHLGDGDRPKYDQPHGVTARLFNLRALHRAGSWIAVTEGEMDCMILSQAGIPAVGVPGANQWKGHLYRNRIFDGMDVTLFADNDDAGQALVRAMNDLRGLDIRYAESPAKDVNDQWMNMNQNLQEFRKWALPASPEGQSAA